MADSEELRKLSKDYQRKHYRKPDWSDEDSQVVFKLRPSMAHAWRAPRCTPTS